MDRPTSFVPDDTAQAAYEAWAANKPNQPSWANLPDFRRETWRRVARASINAALSRRMQSRESGQ